MRRCSFVAIFFPWVSPTARNIEPLTRFYTRELTFSARLLSFGLSNGELSSRKIRHVIFKTLRTLREVLGAADTAAIQLGRRGSSAKGIFLVQAMWQGTAERQLIHVRAQDKCFGSPDGELRNSAPVGRFITAFHFHPGLTRLVFLNFANILRASASPRETFSGRLYAPRLA